MTKNAICLIAGVIGFQFVMAQRVVNNILLFDVDDNYNVIDTLLPKIGLYNILCYQCQSVFFNKDSCILNSRKRYDETGRLVELAKTGKSSQDSFSFEVRFRKVNGGLYEAITRYSLQSDAIPDDFYFDTIIKGRSEKRFLYKKDKNNKLYVRSLYAVNSSGNLVIKRYDLNGRLVHLYYPYGSRRALKQSSDTAVSEFDSVITRKDSYTENEVMSRIVYNKKGNICEITDVNNTFGNVRKSILKKHFFYNSNDQLKKKVTVDGDNQLISEEQFYYEKNHLVKYTEDDDLDDSVLREERIYDKSARMVLLKNYNKYNGGVMTWEYIYNSNGLLEKEVYCLDNKHVITRVYVYN